ncbi:AbiTii domain-containing protein [Micromonospora chalcea]|uniref:AbiTii domain-containing protein n=1 Tax=Micromonospora chalcea TaxID=1874 RepID=UPI00380DB529
MTETLLRSLREHLLDESEPLAGLLRKCLLLGAETGSEALREWARRELNGYGDEDEVPTYRKFHDVPISMDSTRGRFWRQGDIINRLNVPPAARKYVPEEITFKQPVEELQQLAEQKKLTITQSGLTVAQAVWNRELPPFHNIDSLSFVMSGSTVMGILGQIRTKLVDVVADLTADTPMSELPKKGQVDAAVNHRLGDIYNTTIQTTNGPLAIGAAATASTEGLTVEDALRLLDKVQQAAADIADTQRGELLDALTELRAAVESDEPDTGEVVKKVGKLRAIADKLGVASVAAATGGAAQAITELAVSGAFG